MRDLSKLVEKIIPYPANRENRDGFNNEPLIDNLTTDERDQVENLLIDKLSIEPGDLLIVETLGYMKSKKSIDILNSLLTLEREPGNKIIIASSIYQIDPNEKLIDIALTAGSSLTNWYDLVPIFYYLTKFKNKRTQDFISQFTDHKDYLVSYNAKQYVRL